MGNTTFDSLVTFTRSNAAWRWNGAGNIEEIAAGDERYQHDPATLDTSTTTLTLETGTQTITIAGNVTYTVGWIVRISDQSDLTRWMLGEITAIDGNDVTFKVEDNDSVNGTGTASSWYIIHSLGLLVEEQRTRLTTHFSPGTTATTGITATDLTVTKLTDTDNPYAGLEDDVWKVVNSSGASKNVVFGGSVANTNAHSARIQAKVVSGAPTLNVTGTSAPADSQTLNASGNWEKNLLENFTPGNADNQIQVTVPNGAEVHLIGATLEEGAFVTSEILGNGTTVTRNADDAKETSIDTSWYPGSPPWVMIVEGQTPQTTRKDIVAFSKDGTSNTVLCKNDLMFANATSNGSASITKPSADTTHKWAFRLRSDQVAICVDGGTVSTDSMSGFTDDTNQVQYGANRNGLNQFGGTLALVAFYAQDMTDAELQELTS